MKKTVIILPTLRSPSLRRLCIPHMPANAQAQPHRHCGYAAAPPLAATCHRKRHWHRTHAIALLAQTHAYASMPRRCKPRCGRCFVFVPHTPAAPPACSLAARWRCLRRWLQCINQRQVIAMK